VSERVEKCTPTHGLRACLHQIIHRNGRKAKFLDAVSIVAETDGVGQMRATDEEVIECLSLLLTYQNRVTLVFDGLDECTNPSDLFKTVRELCYRTGAKAVFLGRPNCEPLCGYDSYTAVNLEPWQNANDIRLYLQPEIECLEKDRLLPQASSIEDIVTTLAVRAQGMFLWARLVVRYLSNAWLSPAERIDTIFDDPMLDGLENLYGKILAILEQAHPAQKEKVHRIFQAMAISRTPFTLPELRQIVAIKPGRVTREVDFIVDFEKCLPIMCAALVECGSNGTVRFIHSSFRDFLVETRYHRDSPLAVTKQSSWLTLTTICLSYLTYDIPRGPITTTKSKNEQHALISKSFPLLRYGIMRLRQDDQDLFDTNASILKEEVHKAGDILQALGEWIKQKLCVTAWVEANFYSQQVPTMEPLISMMSIWHIRYEAHRSRISALLSPFLQLEQDPCAIWTSTITAFTKSTFWFTQADTKVTCLGEKPRTPVKDRGEGDSTPTMILVKSQTSINKRFHATIHVIPSKSLPPLQQ
jgi:hypothetical protein